MGKKKQEKNRNAMKIIKILLETNDGKIVDLTLKEATDLHNQLEALFGEKRTECIYADKD